VARRLVLAATAVFGAALAVRPDAALRLFWYAIVPALPAVFLVNAELWRNVCPVATLNTLRAPSPDVDVRSLDARWVAVATTVGIALFFVLVPARLFLLDTDPGATGALLSSLGGTALVGGFVLDRKAGFCNSICPLLPVERLYGQRPLLVVGNARCAPCRACTRSACLDLNPERSGFVSLGPASSSGRWYLSPFGAFALALPGMITGYFLVQTGSVTLDAGAAPTAGIAYAATAGGAALTWAVLTALFRFTHTPPARALVWAAALAAALFYWFVPASSAAAWGLPSGAVWLLRAGTLGLVGAWAIRGLRRTR
jgi:hypothetical protein